MIWEGKYTRNTVISFFSLVRSFTLDGEGVISDPDIVLGMNVPVTNNLGIIKTDCPGAQAFQVITSVKYQYKEDTEIVMQ